MIYRPAKLKKEMIEPNTGSPTENESSNSIAQSSASTPAKLNTETNQEKITDANSSVSV